MVAIARQYKRELERKDALLLTLTSANSQALYNAAVDISLLWPQAVQDVDGDTLKAEISPKRKPDVELKAAENIFEKYKDQTSKASIVFARTLAREREDEDAADVG